MIAPEVLELLCCPATHLPLRIATMEELRAVNQPGQKNAAGKEVSGAINDALVREDGTMLYPIYDSIPCLIAAEGIPLVPASNLPTP